MKALIKIPIEEVRGPNISMWAHVEVEVDGTPEEVHTTYQEYAQPFRFGEGLPRDEFNRIYDEFRTTGKVVNGIEAWEKMNSVQQSALQELKKSIKRCNK